MPTTRDLDPQVADNGTPAELAIAGLLRAVLSPEERQLLAAFHAIADRTVRQSLVAVACAAAGLDDTEAREPEDSRAVARGLPLPGETTITLRRVRELLR